MLIIFYLSSQEQLPDVQVFFKHADKIAHFGVYFILGIFIKFAFYQNIQNKLMLINILTLAVGTFFAYTDEYHQSFVPNRVSSLVDLIFDIFGILLSLFIFDYLRWLIEKSLIKKGFK